MKPFARVTPNILPFPNLRTDFVYQVISGANERLSVSVDPISEPHFRGLWNTGSRCANYGKWMFVLHRQMPVNAWSLPTVNSIMGSWIIECTKMKHTKPYMLNMSANIHSWQPCKQECISSAWETNTFLKILPLCLLVPKIGPSLNSLSDHLYCGHYLVLTDYVLITCHYFPIYFYIIPCISRAVLQRNRTKTRYVHKHIYTYT